MESTKKRLLVFSDWFLPGYKAGGPIRSLANLVEHIQRDFEIFLVCGDRDYMDNKPYPGIKPNVWVEKYGIKLIYLPPENQQINTCSSIIDRLNPDLVYINGIFSKPFSINPLLALRNSRRKVIVAPRGMLAKGALGIKPFKKRVYLRFARILKLYEKVHFHATSEQEKQDISTFFHRNQITTIPNLPSIGIKTPPKRKEKKINQLEIICVARIAPEKNIDFAIECLSKLDGELKVYMCFIGSVYDDKYMEKCTAKSKLLPANIEVDFLGSKTPNEIAKYLDKSHLFFLPTLGENYGHAIVEAFGRSLPALISDKTPWKHLNQDRLGADYALSDTSAFSGFIEKVAKMTKEEYNDYVKGIKSRFAKRVDLKGNISSYKELFDAKG
jgi:glycosyltransferase involved in cell wall biosynthesis